MEAKPSDISSSFGQGPMQHDYFQQEFNISHHPSSESSQTYTNAPSGTSASAQNATVTTENLDPIAYEALLAHHMQALSADEQDLSLVGSWTAAVDPHPDTFLIENDPILSSIHRVGAAVDFARKYSETTDRNGSDNTKEAVGTLRASLHRKV